jgi:hypothetical protein
MRSVSPSRQFSEQYFMSSHDGFLLTSFTIRCFLIDPVLRILQPSDSTIEIQCFCHYNLERYRDAGRWQMCISTNVCARAKAKARVACVVVLDVTTVISPRITTTAICGTRERGWYAVRRNRIAGSPGTDLEPAVHSAVHGSPGRLLRSSTQLRSTTILLDTVPRLFFKARQLQQNLRVYNAQLYTNCSI